MEYEYCSPNKRRKISHANDQQVLDHSDLEKEIKNNPVIQGSTMVAAEESGSQVRNDDGQSHSRKKLLVLDVNGLLVDIVADPDETRKPDTVIAFKAVFKRPYCDEFLKFCFERFSVGVWTSRTRRNIKQVLDFLMGDTQRQLLFCWDQSHCTETGFNTIENTSKPLLLKELKRLWEKEDPNLPWDRGVYDESNTLLLDDSPYKALRNPPYCAIFPNTYSYRDTQDNGLGPNGDLRNYLERLAASDNVQKFIEQNPFGQQPITHDNESWNFYHNIICSTQPGVSPRARKKLIVIDIGGLLVDVRKVPREGFREDTMLGSRAVFKRPYCDEFLQFCFQRFNVGVWTTVIRSNTERALDFLMRDTQRKLLFSWDLAHCTDTGFYTVENNDKKLLLKEIRKLWEKTDPNLPWEIGDYNESNTLLVDNNSHRALLNPPHTAIFPYPYCHWHTEDNSLGPKGDLRLYLERLAASENVQKFVSENSFGQRPIREKNLSWGFYQKVIRAFSYKLKAGDSVDAKCKSSSERKPDTTIASVTKTLSEPKTASPTVLTAPTLLEPEIGTTIALVGQTLSEPDLDSTARVVRTSLEPETMNTTILTAPTLLEPETGATISLVGQTLSEPEIDTTSPAAHTLLEPETLSDDAHPGFTASSKRALAVDVDNVTVGSALSAQNESPSPKRYESNSAVNNPVTCSMDKRTVSSVEDNSCVKRFQSSAGSEGNTKANVSVVGTSGSDDIKQDSPPMEHGNIVTESNSALDGSVTCNRKKRVVNSVEDDSHGKRSTSLAGSEGNRKYAVLALETRGFNKQKRRRSQRLVDMEKTSGADDGKSCQKRRGSPPKLVVKEPTGVLEDGHGITTDLDEQQPLSVWYEQKRRLSALKRSSRLSPPDHHDKSLNQAIVNTTGTTNDYQQDWPFIKLCPIWAAIESLMLDVTPPQKPHFSPLKKAEELCREGLAIAHIVTYWKLVQMLSDLKPDDSVDIHIINSSLKILVDLETHGFNVDAIRGHLNELLCLKSESGQQEDTLKELEKCNYEKLAIEIEMDQLKVKMQKLQEDMARVERMQKVKEEEIMRLQSKLASCFQPNQ